MDELEHAEATDPFDSYTPKMTPERLAMLRAWHEKAYERDASNEDRFVTYLGREFVIPPEVHPIQGMAENFGLPLLDEVRPGDRVLDLGTGSGVNAILAASIADDVVAVDVNPVAVECARANAERNGVAHRVDVRLSDVFDNVDGRFDLIIFDPPFRWFKPRDLREMGSADENYGALRAFFREVHDYLNPEGRVFLSFGTTGDIDFLRKLIDAARLQVEVLTERSLTKDGETVWYFTYRLMRQLG